MTENAEKVLSFLTARGLRGATGIEIEETCWPIVGVRDYVRRLRDKGYKIETREEPRTEKNCRVVKYVLYGTPTQVAVEKQGELFA